jgi:hypothetical protein
MRQQSQQQRCLERQQQLLWVISTLRGQHYNQLTCLSTLTAEHPVE